LVDPVCGKQVREYTAEAATFFEGRIYYFCSGEHKAEFLTHPEDYSNQVSMGKVKFGVMGAASGDLPQDIRNRAYELGAAVARKCMVMVTGAAPGFPWESANGAQEHGGLSIGISPALSLDEHLDVYDSPTDVFDVMIYTGSGLMGREVVNIRSSDLIAIIGGHSGTLGEFAIAYDEGKLIGVLEGSSGIADIIPDLVTAIDKETGSTIIYDSDPHALVERMVDTYVTKHFRRPSIFVRNNRGKHTLPG